MKESLKTKSVAVILPVYKNDKPEYAISAIDSVLNQTLSNVHLYIGVDGPIGGNLEEVLAAYSKLPNVKICRYLENRGLACVLNDLLAEAFRDGAEYIARMDADDISMPDRFEKQVKFLQTHPEVDVVGGAIEEIDERSNVTGKIIKYPHTHAECRRFFRYRDPFAHPAVMFYKTFFLKVRGYRNEYRKNQDTMLWYDALCARCQFANLDCVILQFRVTPDFYKTRRGGLMRAKQMLKDRMMINKDLQYDMSANLFALAMFFMTIMPTFVRKFLYQIR